VKKKGRLPIKEQYTLRKHFVVTSAQTPLQMWTDTVTNLSTEIKAEFRDYDFAGSPFESMTTHETAKGWVLGKLEAGEVGQEYLGNHGVGGNLYPPLEYFDAQHRWLWDQPEWRELVENWREMLDEETHGARPVQEDDSEPSDDEPAQ
jgi:hypothetical protein